MNKFAKGAIATGVGVILLAGGGGTLATWNQAQNANMGSVVAGDLNLTTSAGVWKNAKNQVITIASYKVVPGDVLTFTQPLTVTLEGDLMVAKLALTGDTALNGFVANDVETSTTLTNAVGATVAASTPLDQNNDGAFTATTTFNFLQGTGGRSSVNGEYNFSAIGYNLVQEAPDNTPIAP